MERNSFIGLLQLLNKLKLQNIWPT